MSVLWEFWSSRKFLEGFLIWNCHLPWWVDWSKNRGHGVAVLYTENLRRSSLIMMIISREKMWKSSLSLKKRRIPFPNRTGSYPGIISLSRAQEISWQYLLLRTVILQKKSRWVLLTVACEEAHCEKSRVSGKRKEMWEWVTGSFVARQSHSKWSRACSQAKHTGSNSSSWKLKLFICTIL